MGGGGGEIGVGGGVKGWGVGGVVGWEERYEEETQKGFSGEIRDV